MRLDGPLLNQASVCEPILRALPEWFGIEAAIQRYVTEIDALPTWLARLDGRLAGFLTLKYHSEYAAEVYVMGVQAYAHRHGLGRALVARAEDALRQARIEYLQVKTLSPSVDYVPYARTRAFYAALGFRPLEEIVQLWGEENPCLLMVKYLGAQEPR